NKEILSKETDQTQKTCPLNEKYNKIAVSMSYTPVLSEKCPNSQNTDTHSQPKTSSFENQMPSLQENFSIEIPPNLPLQPSKSPKQKLRINIQTIKRRRTYKKRLRFCFSGLENKELSKCEIICSKLTKKFKDFDIVESIEEATHLFVKLNEEKLCTRRYKYLYAGLAGIPIIDCEFLRKLKKDYNIHQFYNFIPHGDKIFGRSTLPQNCFKENRKIFEKAIFFMEGIKITKECEQLIAIAGGLKRKGTKQPDDIELTNQKEIFDYISANEFL
ncbi:putative BRCT protein, partial [Pseudoloma neurophilia]